MKKILILTMPSQSLVLPRRYTTISMSGTTIGGAVNNNGYPSDHIDLNLELAKYRFSQIQQTVLDTVENEEHLPEFILTEFETETLSKFDKLKLLINDTITLPRIEQWIDILLNYLLNNIAFTNYDAICYSLERKTSITTVSLCAFSFIILFNKKLQEKLNNKIVSYVGGHYALRYALLSDMMAGIAGLPSSVIPTRIFLGYGINTFPLYLTDNLIADINDPCRENVTLGNYAEITPEINSSRVITLEHEIGTTLHPLLAKNFKNNIIDSDNIFPIKFYDKYPELRSTPFAKYASYKFSSGCMFKCAFCSEGSVPYQLHTTDNAIDVFKYFYDNGIKHIQLFDTNINFKKEWVKELCNKLVQKNIKIKWSDSANLRIYDKEMIYSLSEAGCVKIWWGTETIVPRILKIIHKYIPIEQTFEVLETAHDAGIWNMCNMILNFPYETEDEYNQLYNFIKAGYQNGIINGYQANIFKVLPYSEYFDSPEKFNIKILNRKNTINEYKYTEINGRAWEQIHRDGIRKEQQILTDPDFIHNIALFNDDLLFFTLHDAFNGNKTKIAEAINYLDALHTNYTPPGSNGFAFKFYSK